MRTVRPSPRRARKVGSRYPDPSYSPISSVPSASAGGGAPVGRSLAARADVWPWREEGSGPRGTAPDDPELDPLRDLVALGGEGAGGRVVREDVGRQGQVDGRREVGVDQ